MPMNKCLRISVFLCKAKVDDVDLTAQPWRALRGGKWCPESSAMLDLCPRPIRKLSLSRCVKFQSLNVDMVV
jgi:hypothetical protein